jgi:hypothetical protein
VVTPPDFAGFVLCLVVSGRRLRARLKAAELFRPGTAYDASRQPDGTIRLAELVEKDVPVVCPRRIGGASATGRVELSSEAIAAAIQAIN